MALNFKDLYNAFDQTPNIDTFAFVGHSGVPGGYSGPRPDDAFLFLHSDPHPGSKNVAGKDIAGLPTKNVRPGAFFLLMGCGTAATVNQPRVGQYQYPGLAPGQPSLGQRFKRRFRTADVYGFAPHVTPGRVNLFNMLFGDSTFGGWNSGRLGTLYFHNGGDEVFPTCVLP